MTEPNKPVKPEGTIEISQDGGNTWAPLDDHHYTPVWGADVMGGGGWDEWFIKHKHKYYALTFGGLRWRPPLKVVASTGLDAVTPEAELREVWQSKVIPLVAEIYSRSPGATLRPLKRLVDTAGTMIEIICDWRKETCQRSSSS